MEKLLEEYRSGQLDKGEALSRIKDMYFEDLGFAKIDHHRSIRRDFPEVIFGQNKTDEQLLKIAEQINKYSGLLLVTRTSHRAYRKLKQKMPEIKFNPVAKIIYTPVSRRAEIIFRYYCGLRRHLGYTGSRGGSNNCLSYGKQGGKNL
ncbi:MAG: hypothetical protein U5N58_04525 [Actinomycetota bacterium]|nr:hypothetical protein [Actinomycetota bacterium]